jgi:hypothetical protein
MKNKLISSLVVATLASISFATSSAFASDIVAKQLRVAKSAALPGMSLSRETVHFSWNLDGAAIASPTPFAAVSRECFVEASAADLSGGIALKSSAPGTVIKLTPRSRSGNLKSAPALSRDDIVVRVGGRTIDPANFATLVDDSAKFAQSQSSGIAFAPGSLAFQINPSMGATDFQFALKNAASDYLIHVFEPQSKFAVSLTTTREAYLTGESVGVRVIGLGSDIVGLTGGFASPQGEITSMTFTRNADGSFVGNAPLNASAAGELFEAFVMATLHDGSNTILRDAKVGFAVADATARSTGVARIAADDGALTYNVSLDVASAGRYSAEAVLYGMADGKRVPVAMAQTGAWLEPGDQNVSLRFENLDLAARGISGPYTLGQFVLKNQGTLQVVERRANVRLSNDGSLRLRGSVRD